MSSAYIIREILQFTRSTEAVKKKEKKEKEQNMWGDSQENWW